MSKSTRRDKGTRAARAGAAGASATPPTSQGEAPVSQPRAMSIVEKNAPAASKENVQAAPGGTALAPADARPPAALIENLFPDYLPKAFAQRNIAARIQWVTELRKAYLGEGLTLYMGAGVSMSVKLPSWNELIQSLSVTMMSRKVNSAAYALSDLKAEDRAATLDALLKQVEQQRQPDKPILMMARAIKDEF